MNMIFHVIISTTALVLASVPLASSDANVNAAAKTDSVNTLPNLLSALHIFEDTKTLRPASQFHLYELVKGSFSDYAEKQRLVYIPQGKVISFEADGNIQFPDGSILAKTFLYLKDQRHKTADFTTIETRVMLRIDGTWIYGSYLWNRAGDDAVLQTKDVNTRASWIDGSGQLKTISYHIPSSGECGQCHTVGKRFEAIGPKLRNWNSVVSRNGRMINQLQLFEAAGILQSGAYESNHKNSSDEQDIVTQARLYLDINCGHCHRDSGSCSSSTLRLSMEELDDKTLFQNSSRITRFMRNGRMPLIGTTQVDEAGLALITSYLKTISPTTIK